MTNKKELSKKQINLLVQAYNSTIKKDEPRMLNSEFDPDNTDFGFWGPTLLRLYSELIVSKLDQNRDIEIAKLTIKSRELFVNFWEIAVILTNDLAVGAEIEKQELLAPFKRLEEDKYIIPRNISKATTAQLFNLANYCFQRGK